MTTTVAWSRSTAPRMRCGEFPGGQLGRVDFLNHDVAAGDVAVRHRRRAPARGGVKVSMPSSNRYIATCSPACRRRDRHLAWQWRTCRLLPDRAAASRCRDRCRRPAAGRSRRCPVRRQRLRSWIRDSAATSLGNTSTPAGGDHEVVKSSLESHAAQLHHAQPPALGTVLGRELLQGHDAVRQALQLKVPALATCGRPAAARCSCGRRRTVSAQGSAADIEAGRGPATAFQTASRRRRAAG